MEKYEITIFEKHRQEMEQLKKHALSMEVQSKEDAKNLITFVARGRKLAKKIDLVRKDLIEESKAYIDLINKLSKQFLDPLEELENTLEEKLYVWKETQTDEVDTSSIKTDEASAIDSISHIIVLENIKLVPAEYLLLNEKLIITAIKMGIRTIPGILIKDIIKTTIRSK